MTSEKSTLKASQSVEVGSGGRVVVPGRGVGEDSVVCERGQGGAGHGVHGAGDDEFADVHGVGVGRVLHPGGRPQGPLNACSGRREALPTRLRGHLLECPVCQPGVGDRSLALECKGLWGAEGVEAAVDLAVDAGDEE